MVFESNKSKLVCEPEETELNEYKRIYVAVAKGLVTSSKPESYVGGNIAATRVSQPGQMIRVSFRRRDVYRRREIQHVFL